MKSIVIVAAFFLFSTMLFADALSVGRFILSRLPSKGALATDAFVGAVIDHDGSKLGALAWKLWMDIPVDQRGRLYDVSDVSTQSVRFISNMMGLGIVGDLFAQTFVEAGVTWRSSGQTNSFADHLSQNGLGSVFVNALRTTPVKIAVGYVIGEAINKLVAFNFTRSIAKSVLVTTGCKIATDLARQYWQSKS